MIKKIFLNESFILSIIILNALTILLGAFDELPADTIRWIHLADHAITIIFIIELIVKISHFGFRGYLASNWDKLDFILITLSVPALLSWLFDLPATGLSFFLIFRVLRVFKSFRFIQFVPGINHLIIGVIRALKTSLIVLLGLIVYIFIVGIISSYLYRDLCPEFFGDPILSFYSILKVFLMSGWQEIPELIEERASLAISILSKIYFVLVLITGGVFGLSLVNSIFVDAMLSQNTEDLSKKIDDLDNRMSSIDEKLKSLINQSPR